MANKSKHLKENVKQKNSKAGCNLNSFFIFFITPQLSLIFY